MTADDAAHACVQRYRETIQAKDISGLAEGAFILEIEDGLIVRETDYFAPRFDAPEWLAQWVERF